MINNSKRVLYFVIFMFFLARAYSMTMTARILSPDDRKKFIKQSMSLFEKEKHWETKDLENISNPFVKKIEIVPVIVEKEEPKQEIKVNTEPQLSDQDVMIMVGKKINPRGTMFIQDRHQLISEDGNIFNQGFIFEVNVSDKTYEIVLESIGQNFFNLKLNENIIQFNF